MISPPTAPLPPGCSFSERFRTLRKSRRLTQREAAQLLSVAVSTVQKWEIGINQPAKWCRPGVLAKLEAHLPPELQIVMDGCTVRILDLADDPRAGKPLYESSSGDPLRDCQAWLDARHIRRCSITWL